VIDDALGDEVRVTVIAAGFDRTTEQANAEPPRSQAATAADDESVWPTPGGRRPTDARVSRPGPAAGPAERREPERREPEQREPERREPERRARFDDDDELDIPSFLKR
jgi:cell division protein FtsZ